MSSADGPRILVVGAGAIGGIVGAGLTRSGRSVTMATTNSEIGRALRERGFEVLGKESFRVPAGQVLGDVGDDAGRFDVVFLAVQPPQVEAVARSLPPRLTATGRVVCFQNGLCEERVARVVGADRVVGAVVAWGASMVGPGRYDRTSRGGFTVGRLDGALDGEARRIAALLEPIGRVVLTTNLRGARWSKLAINCAISTLGTIGGDRVGPLLRRTFARRLALEVMTEAVRVARAEGVRLEKVAGTIDLDWLALPGDHRNRSGMGTMARHAVLLSAGLKYRRLRSSMLSAIERGRAPAVDFLNGEVVERGERHGVDVPVNRAATDLVWQIAQGKRRPSLATLRELYEATR